MVSSLIFPLFLSSYFIVYILYPNMERIGFVYHKSVFQHKINIDINIIKKDKKSIKHYISIVTNGNI